MEDFERRGGFGGGRGRFGGGRGRGRGGGGSRDDFGEKPVKVGEEYDVEIESVAEKGDGVAKIKGLVIFVPGAQKGERIRIRIKELKRSSAIAERVGEAAEAPAEAEEAPAEGAESEQYATEESAESGDSEGQEEEY
jgi:predicted RNA-binding protein with TRAM domain